MDEQTQKLLESLSRLSSASDDYYEKVRAQTDNYNTLLAAGMKQEAAVARNAVIVTKTNEAYDQQMKALGLTKNALGEFERITAQLTKEQKQRIAEEQAIKDRQESRDKMSASYHAMMADKTGTAIKALNKFGEGLNKTIFDSTKGQAKYGSILSGAGDAVQNFGSMFGPLGKAVTFVTGAFMKLAGAALEQQEHLNTAYEKMAEFGAIDVTGVAGMFKNLQNAGFTVKELDKFGSILKTAGPNLAIMGTTAADGAKKFADTMGAVKNSGVEKELRMLGFTSETMAKTFADYQGLMARQGFLQGKTTAQIAQESAKYAKTLDELSKLTGESRDEIQKKMDADANDMKFRLKLQEVDGTTRERLQKASVLISDFGEDTASGFREMVANNGKVVGDASAKLMLSTGNAAKQIVEDLNAGKISHLEAARLMAEAKAKQVERFRAVGKLDADIMKELGLSVKDMDAINKYRGKTQKDLEDIENKQKLQASGALDKQRAAEVARVMTERNLEQSKDKLINIVGTKMVGAFEKLMQVINSFAKGLAKFVKFFGGPDLTDLFETPDDIKKQIEDAQKELLHAEKSATAGPVTAGLTGEEAMQAQAEYEDQQRKLQEKRDKVAQLQEKYKSKVSETGEEAESPEQQKLKKEAEKLAKERAEMEELEADKSKILYKQTLEKLKLSEEDLKDKEKAQKFEEAYTGAKQKYVDRQGQIDKRLIAIGEESATIKQKEADKKLGSGAGAGADAGGKASPGKPGSSSKSPGGAAAGAGGGGSEGGGGKEANDGKPPQGASGSGPTMSDDEIKKMIIRHEGIRTRPYKDSMGLWTVGVGHLIGDGKSLPPEWNREFSNDEVMALFDKDYEEHKKAASSNVPNFNQMTGAGKGAFTDLTFNMGPNWLSKWPNTKKALEEKNSAAIAQGLQSSQWYNQVGSRAPEITAMASQAFPQARYGGIFSGPQSGYPVLMHGKEAVIPMPKLGELGNSSSVSKTELGQSMNAAGAGANSSMDQFISMQTDLMNMIANKLDQLDSRLAKSNDIQENILTYSAA